MHDRAGLKLGIAEDFVVGPADQQAGQGEDLVILANPRCQLLCLGLQFGGERLIRGHDGLLAPG